MSEAKTSFDNQLYLLLFACHATEPFSVKDVQEAVFDFHRTTVHKMLQNFEKWNYLERVTKTHYRATQYAKDIINVDCSEVTA